MAFNPFDVFRRNQRIIFAGLTVVIMFMFVLSSGLGGKSDFFEWLPSLVAQKVQSGDVLAVVNGKKVYESELNQLATNRVLANEYMANAALVSTNKLANALTTQIDKASPDNRPLFQEIERTRPYYLPQQIMQAVMTGRFPQDMVQQFQQESLGRMRARLAEIITKADSKAEDVTLAKQALQLIDLDQRTNQFQQGVYFTNLPNRSEQERMDFFLWKQKADELGIRFTDADIQTLIKGEFDNLLSGDDWAEVEKQMGRKEGYNPDSLRRAVGDEFRVRMAMTAVMGRAVADPTSATLNVYDAPYDYFEYYKDQLSETRYFLTALPAANFLEQVTGQPSESELMELFKKYARTEPNPFSPNPGFKEPRRLKLGWLEATGQEPFYKALAEKVFPASGVMPIELIAVVGGVATPTGNLLQAAYEKYRTETRETIDFEWFTKPGSRFSKPSVVDGSVVRPQNLAAAAGVAAGSLLTAGTPFNAPLTLEQTAITLELQTRAKALASLLSPPLVVGDRFGAFAALTASIPKPLPLPIMQPVLVEKLRDELTYTLAAADLEKFQTELTKLGEKLTKPSSDPTAAREFVEKFVKERGLKTGSSTEFHDQFSMGEDPGLAHLKQKAAGPHGGTVDTIQFGRRFFYEPDRRTGRDVPTKGLFLPQAYPSPVLTGPNKTDPAILVWRTAEIEENAPKSLDAKGVREKVVAAWKLNKAKELARKAAEELAKKSEKLGDNATTIVQKLLDLHKETAEKFTKPEDKARVKFFEIDQVAPLVDTPLPMAARTSVGSFQLTPNSNIPYPSQEMAQKLVEHRNQPMSAPLVLANAPEDTFYVAVLLNRAHRDASQFGYQIYNAPSIMGNEVATAVSQRHQANLWIEARKQALDLLKQEFDYKDENPKLNAKIME
ncbi:MAG: hypothetical protein LC104_18630 [Bacteroidales bacterium]|nr:hypothetical protein [Bacteroidales bacterium]